MSAISLGLGLCSCICVPTGDIAPVEPPVEPGPAPDLLLTSGAVIEIEVSDGLVSVTIADTGLYDGTYTFRTDALADGPVMIVPPVLMGAGEPGATLTARPGLYVHPADRAPAIAYRWLRDGTAIAGATGTTYTVVEADRGTALSVAETATNADGTRVSISAALAIPTTYSKVVFIGASIIEQTFGQNISTPNAGRTSAFRTAGLPVDVYGYGFGGAVISTLRPRLAEAMAAHPTDTLFVVHIGGNNVTGTRPYASAGAGQLAAIGTDFDALIADIGARKADVILCPLTFRTYEDAADILSRTTVFSSEELGSRPYNDAIFLPKIAAWRPDLFHATGEPIVDIYNATRNGYQTYVSADGIHPVNPAGRDLLAQAFVDGLGSFVTGASLPAPVARQASAQLTAQKPAVALPAVTQNAAYAPVTTPVLFCDDGPLGALTYTITGVPAGMSITLLRGRATVSGTPTASGSFAPRIVASDGTDTATCDMTLTVNAATVTPPAAPLIVNFGNTPAGFAGTSFTAANVNGAAVPLKYGDGTPSPVSLRVTHPAAAIVNNDTWNNNVNGGRSTGVAAYDGTLYNDTIYSSSLFSQMSSGPLTLILSGLAAGAGHVISFGASRSATDTRVARLTDGATTISVTATANPPERPASGTFLSNGSGIITLTLSNPSGGNTFAYIGGLKIAAA